MKLEINDILQWTGTVCFMAMYTLMSFFPTLFPLNIVAGACGSTCYLIWCFRVANKPQMIVNTIGILVCLAGLAKYYAIFG
jgi:hypothetical protein